MQVGPANGLAEAEEITMFPFLTAVSWIIIYCLHPGRCDVVKANDGIAVQQYQTEQACKADGPRLIFRGATCTPVNSVSCYKGGSACTFDPADDAGWGKLRQMVPFSPPPQ